MITELMIVDHRDGSKGDDERQGRIMVDHGGAPWVDNQLQYICHHHSHYAISGLRWVVTSLGRENFSQKFSKNVTDIQTLMLSMSSK